MPTGSRRRRSEPGARSLRKEGGSTWRPRTALPPPPVPPQAAPGARGGTPSRAQGPRLAGDLTEAGAGGVQLL